MTTELAKTYSPVDVEPEVAARWEAARAFHAEPTDPGKPYSIVIPPPNVTAALHMGHALNNTIQDILIRHHRMLGDNTMWMPGTDHAGIATQTVVEKRVLKEEGKRRTDFSREEFVAKIQAWKDEYEAVITGQLKSMGCSCDWERQRFTMDEICARAVREAFFRLFRDGLIYRGKRLVNWDPVTQTALADDEVEMHEIDGHFWYLKYPVVERVGESSDEWRDTGEFVTVATTRPETMLGDTAVAVNPNDALRAHYIGKFVRLPIVNRIIPIIGDDYVVIPDPDSDDAKAKYASGFLKVTPAHDPNDWEIGLRHGLPIINVMAPDGTISNEHGWPADDFTRADVEAVPLKLDRYEARKAIVEWFRANDLLADVKPYRHAVGHSYRSHVPIEPYLSDQWYVRVTDDRLAGAALRAMAADQRTDSSGKPAAEGTEKRDWEGCLRFYPARYAKTFQTWHENIRDWCISRQLWWGHRIPVWSQLRSADQGPDEGNPIEAMAKSDDRIAVVRTDTDIYVCLREDDSALIAELESIGFTRDPDVLDTWFSSALWPLSTMGWPEDTPVLATWNPTNVLCTAREIITLWVSRMVMFNLYFLDRLPFHDVFIHAMIQDGEGRKMSKSLGNGVDPLDIIHSHGADAMRFTLASMTTNTQDVRMPVKRDPQTGRNTSEKFDIGRNFANKLWNAVRFALGKLSENANASAAANTQTGAADFNAADHWILARLAATIRDTTQAINHYEFADYARALYDFIWRDLCDWYIEAVKPTVAGNETQRQVLATCIDAALRLLHPVMPFITEKLWEHLNAVMPQRGVSGVQIPPSELLIRARWPQVSPDLAEVDTKPFTVVQDVVTAIRQVRTQHKVAPRQVVPVSIQSRDGELIRQQRELIQTLANVTLEAVGPDVQRPADAAAAVLGEDQIYLHGLIDAEAERTRIARRAEELRKSIEALTKRLQNPSYVEKAPAHLVQQTRDQLVAAEKELAALEG